MHFRLRLLLLPLIAVLFMGMAHKKEPFLQVRFHCQANQQDSAIFASAVWVNGRSVFIQKIPVFTEHEVVAIWPFDAPDGSFGCTFKLDEHGRIDLDAASAEFRGTPMVAMINGRVVTALLIDKRVRDGIITISAGLTQQEVDTLRKYYRIIGAPIPHKSPYQWPWASHSTLNGTAN